MNPRCLPLGLGLLLLPPVAHAQDCVDLVDAIDAINASLADVDIESAKMLADEATQQLECQPQPVNTVMVAGLFQLAGAVAAFAGEVADAEAFFARAVAISPTAPIDSVYGDDVEQQYQQVQRRLMEEPGGSLLLTGTAEAWLDGRKVTMGMPLDVVVGHHLLQWQEEDEPLQARELRVAAMETRQLTLGQADPDAGRRPPRQPREPREPREPRPVVPKEPREPVELSSTTVAMLAGGGAGIVAGGALLALAAGAHGSFFEEQDPDALQGIKVRNRIFAVSGLTLMAAGAGTAGVSFFVHDGPGVRVGVQF